MEEITLIKYLNNKCSDEEFEEFVSWVKKEANIKDGGNWSLNQWKKFEPEFNIDDNKKFSNLLDKIHDQINLQHHVKKSGKLIILSKVKKWLSLTSVILNKCLMEIAFYTLPDSFQMNKITGLTIDYIEVIIPIDSRAVVHLTDETRINLNYGGRIKYLGNQIKNSRETRSSLEPFFDVIVNSINLYIQNLIKKTIPLTDKISIIKRILV